MKKAGMVNEAGLAQTEATYFNICTTVLDLKEQINQAENSLALLLAETPHKYSVANWEINSCRKTSPWVFPYRCLPTVLTCVAQNFRWHRLSIQRMPHVLLSILPSR